jgi:hypothetical protein
MDGHELTDDVLVKRFAVDRPRDSQIDAVRFARLKIVTNGFFVGRLEQSVPGDGRDDAWRGGCAVGATRWGAVD